MNIFNGHRLSQVNLCEQVHGVVQKHVDGSISAEEANKALLLICMSRAKDFEQGKALYENLLVESLDSDDVKIGLLYRFCQDNELNKIKTIKECRTIWGIGLKEAKTKVEGLEDRLTDAAGFKQCGA